MKTIPRQYGLCVYHWVLFLCGGGTSPSVLAKEVSNKEAKPLPHVVRNVAFKKKTAPFMGLFMRRLVLGVKGWKYVFRFCKFETLFR
jgi:hypothetical protein